MWPDLSSAQGIIAYSESDNVLHGREVWPRETTQTINEEVSNFDKEKGLSNTISPHKKWIPLPIIRLVTTNSIIVCYMHTYIPMGHRILHIVICYMEQDAVDKPLLPLQAPAKLDQYTLTPVVKL